MGDIQLIQSGNCCETTQKTILEGCAYNVPYRVIMCTGDCGDAVSLSYINLLTGVQTSVAPDGFQAYNCDAVPQYSQKCVPYLETETFNATAGQTVFTIAHEASGDVRFSRNGATLHDAAAVVSGSVVTYVPGPNNAEVLLANDRIEISYLYVVCEDSLPVDYVLKDCIGNELPSGTEFVTCAALDSEDFTIEANGNIKVNAGGQALEDCLGNVLPNGTNVVKCDALDLTDFSIDPSTGNVTVKPVVIQSKDCITISGSGTTASPYIIGSSSCGGSTETCPTNYKDVVALPANGSVVINHNLDLADPYAFLLSHYNLATGSALNVSITNVTANSFTLVNNSSTLALNYLVNVLRNEACDAVPSVNCDYQYIDVVNSVKTLSSGATATVVDSTGVSFKTVQGITGWNLGDLEDNEKITTTFSVPMKRVRIVFEGIERISGTYERVKVFLNGAPYAIQASQLSTPVTSGGSLNIIDGGFTLDPSSGADDASGIVVIDYPAGITSIALQDIVVSGLPNGAVARLEVKECI